MKFAAWFGLVGGMLAGSAMAQDRLPQDDARRYAQALAAAAKADAGPLNVEVDPDKPVGLRADEYGVMVIPAKGLKAGALAPGGGKIEPIGQLWMRRLAPVVDDAAVPEDKVRVVTVRLEDAEHPLPVYVLGVRRVSSEKLELVALGKGKEPVWKQPLTKADGPASADAPIDLEAEHKGDRGEVTIKILGRYEAKMTLLPQPQ